MSKYDNEKLTKEGFEKFLFALDENQEEAANKYLILRRNLIRFFSGSLLYNASQDLADEVIKRISIQMEKGLKTDSIYRYLFTTSRQVLFEARRSKFHEVSLDDTDASKLPTYLFPEPEHNIYLDCLEECLKHLANEERELIINYYEKEKAEKLKFKRELAENLGISVNSLHVRVYRIRAKLKSCIEKCKEKNM
jgi:DNA-directed RNA polymerase specialized sigma24 family protein